MKKHADQLARAVLAGRCGCPSHLRAEHDARAATASASCWAGRRGWVLRGGLLSNGASAVNVWELSSRWCPVGWTSARPLTADVEVDQGELVVPRHRARPSRCDFRWTPLTEQVAAVATSNRIQLSTRAAVAHAFFSVRSAKEAEQLRDGRTRGRMVQRWNSSPRLCGSTHPHRAGEVSPLDAVATTATESRSVEKESIFRQSADSARSLRGALLIARSAVMAEARVDSDGSSRHFPKRATCAEQTADLGTATMAQLTTVSTRVDPCNRPQKTF